jgi:uncharacterized protein YukE
MTAATTPSPLARFSHDAPAWIGGDIHGLSQFAGLLYGYAPKINNVAGTLNEQVDRMVSAANWQGAGASAFKSSWDKDSVAAQGLAAMADGIGHIVDELAVQLSQIESGLEESAQNASLHGVHIGPEGQPPAHASPMSLSAAASYQQAYETALGEALTARQQAASALAGFTQKGHTDLTLSAAGQQFINNLAGVTGAFALDYSVFEVAGGAGADIALTGMAAAGALVGGATGTTIAAAASIIVLPLAFTAVGYGIGDFLSNLAEGKSPGTSLENAAKAVATPAVDVVHWAEHLF